MHKTLLIDCVVVRFLRQPEEQGRAQSSPWWHFPRAKIVALAAAMSASQSAVASHSSHLNSRQTVLQKVLLTTVMISRL